MLFVYKTGIICPIYNILKSFPMFLDLRKATSPINFFKEYKFKTKFQYGRQNFAVSS